MRTAHFVLILFHFKTFDENNPSRIHTLSLQDLWWDQPISYSYSFTARRLMRTTRLVFILFHCKRMMRTAHFVLILFHCMTFDENNPFRIHTLSLQTYDENSPFRTHTLSLQDVWWEQPISYSYSFTANVWWEQPISYSYFFTARRTMRTAHFVLIHFYCKRTMRTAHFVLILFHCKTYDDNNPSLHSVAVCVPTWGQCTNLVLILFHCKTYDENSLFRTHTLSLQTYDENSPFRIHTLSLQTYDENSLFRTHTLSLQTYDENSPFRTHTLSLQDVWWEQPISYSYSFTARRMMRTAHLVLMLLAFTTIRMMKLDLAHSVLFGPLPQSNSFFFVSYIGTHKENKTLLGTSMDTWYEQTHTASFRAARWADLSSRHIIV